MSNCDNCWYICEPYGDFCGYSEPKCELHGYIGYSSNFNTEKCKDYITAEEYLKKKKEDRTKNGRMYIN